MPWPEFISNDELAARLPMPLTRSMVMILLGTPQNGAIYSRDEDGRWRKLDDRPLQIPKVNDEQ